MQPALSNPGVPRSLPRSDPPIGKSSLAEELDRKTVVGLLWQQADGRVRCVACGHRCLLAEGRRGICKVRFNLGGELRVPFGYVAGSHCDPVEKKPFYHVFPGATAYTFGMLGCDFYCPYCQNWITSQALRDEAAGVPFRVTTPQELVRSAVRCGARLMVSSYNEPLITAEWAAAVFEPARQAGLTCAFVSNGYATPEVLDLLQPYLAACKVDLKSFNDQRHRSLGGTLERVKAGIRMVAERDLWLEIVTLLVPGFNDSERELREMARFIRSLSRDIPWHVTAFHPQYKLTSRAGTTPAQLVRAAEIGLEEGLRFVYAGNATGRVETWENTYCPDCRTLLIERCGFGVRDLRITPEGRCPDCRAEIPGIWSALDG